MFGRATIRLGIGPHSSLQSSVLSHETRVVSQKQLRLCQLWYNFLHAISYIFSTALELAFLLLLQ